MTGQPDFEDDERQRQRAAHPPEETPWADACPQHGGDGNSDWCIYCAGKELMVTTLEMLKRADPDSARGICGNVHVILTCGAMTFPEIVAMVPDILIPPTPPTYQWGGNPLGKNSVVLAVLDQMVDDGLVSYDTLSMTYRLRYYFSERIGA